MSIIAFHFNALKLDFYNLIWYRPRYLGIFLYLTFSDHFGQPGCLAKGQLTLPRNPALGGNLAIAGIQFARMPFDFGHDTTLFAPTSGLIAETGIVVNGGAKRDRRGGVKRDHSVLGVCPRSPREGPARGAACPSG